MKKILFILVVLGIVFLLYKVSYGAALPNDFVAGNKLTASELNSWKNQRENDVKPISSTSNDYLDATYSLGSSSYRWLNGNYSGVVRADGQPRLRLELSADWTLSNSYAKNTTWTEISDVGGMYTAGNNYFLIPESGYYYVGYCFTGVDITGDDIYTILYNETTATALAGTSAYLPNRETNCVNGIFYLTANDNITLQIKETSGGTIYRYSDSTYSGTNISVFKVF